MSEFPVASDDEFDRHPLTAAKCYRHQWRAIESSRAPFGPYPDVVGSACVVCGKVRDEAVRRRNRANKNRGANFERTVAKQLGGRRTGPLGGRDDVVGEMFAAQTKKTINFSVRQARIYLDDLSRSYPTRTPLVVHAEPGRDRDAVVIVRMSDWIALHGPDATR